MREPHIAAPGEEIMAMNGETQPRWRRVLTSRWVIGAAVALALYALIGFLAVPYALERYIPHAAEEQLARRASVEDIQVNPFALTLDVRRFALDEPDGAPILGFGRLFVDFELKSLLRWAWTFAEIRIEQPSIDLIVDADGRLNLARLIDELPAGEPDAAGQAAPPADAPDDAPIRMVLENVIVSGGRASLADNSLATPATALLEPLDLEFKEISTLPDRRGPYAVTATLPGGGRLAWQGDVSLHPLASSGKVDLSGLVVANVWSFLRDRFHLAEVTGTAGLRADYRFGYRDGQVTVGADAIGVDIDALTMVGTGAVEPMLRLAEIRVADARFDLGERRLEVPSVAIRDGEVRASTDAGGVLDWQQLASVRGAAAMAHAPPPAEPPAQGEKPWRIEIAELSIGDVAVRYRDASRAAPLEALVAEAGSRLAVHAEIGSDALELRADDVSVALREVGISAGAPGETLLALDAVELAGGELDLAASRVQVQRIGVTGGGTRIRRAADGSLPQLEMLAAGAPAPPDAEPAPASDEAPAWRFDVAELAVEGFALGFEDLGSDPALAYDLDDVSMVLRRISNDGSTPLEYDARLKVAQGGALRAAGTLAQRGAAAAGEIDVEAINLQPLRPLLARFAALNLESGSVSAKATFDYRATDAGPGVRAAGTVALDQLLLEERDSGERFLAWKRVAAEGIDFALAPDRLSIKEIRLLEPGAKIVVFEDKRVNLATVLAKSGGEAVPADSGAASGAPARVFPVAIERVRVERGVVDFADLSLVLPFATQIQSLEGSIVGISSDAASRATMKLEGRVGEYGRATVDGSLAPFDPKRFTDIAVRFRNVVMTPLSPYSATFAGRKIAGGKLDLDLEYDIDNSALVGENGVVLHALELGEQVESPDAASLPLDLAIALLSDDEGVIDVRLPVSGNVDDPEFSYGHLVWQALTNLISKIVTAPFSALASALGGEAEGLDSVAFDTGRATLPPPEREKLAKLAEALAKRPKLAVTVQGAYADADAAALKDRALRVAIITQTGGKAAPGEDPGPVALDDADTQIALEALLARVGGEGAMKSFQAAYESAAGREAERVSPVMATLGQASDDAEFYRSLYARLGEIWPLEPTALEQLAGARRDAVMRELAAGGLDGARLVAADVQPGEGAAAAPAGVKLSLGTVE